MGCPVPKVAVKSQAGSFLLKNPAKVYEIVSEVLKAVSIPVTVKIRSGWDENSINAIEIAKLCEKAGASLITVHGRTRSQGYSGKCNLDVIRDIKDKCEVAIYNGEKVSKKSKAAVNDVYSALKTSKYMLKTDDKLKKQSERNDELCNLLLDIPVKRQPVSVM